MNKLLIPILLLLSSCGTLFGPVVRSNEIKTEDCFERFLRLGASPEDSTTMCVMIYKSNEVSK